MEADDLEQVPLTEREQTDIAEAWLGQLIGLPRDSKPNLDAMLHGSMFVAVVNQILGAHDFEPSSAEFRWRADGELMLLARRQSSVRASEMPSEQ